MTFCCETSMCLCNMLHSENIASSIRFVLSQTLLSRFLFASCSIQFPCTSLWKYSKFLKKDTLSSVAFWLSPRTRWLKEDLGEGQTLAFCLINDCPDKWQYQNKLINEELIYGIPQHHMEQLLHYWIYRKFSNQSLFSRCDHSSRLES